MQHFRWLSSPWSPSSPPWFPWDWEENSTHHRNVPFIHACLSPSSSERTPQQSTPTDTKTKGEGGEAPVDSSSLHFSSLSPCRSRARSHYSDPHFYDSLCRTARPVLNSLRIVVVQKNRYTFGCRSCTEARRVLRRVRFTKECLIFFPNFYIIMRFRKF